MLGIDVSAHQGVFDWEKAAADGVEFAWCKATEGRTFIDAQFGRNMRQARSYGIPVGAYHFARPDNNRAVYEAEHFLSVLGRPEDGDLLPVLDFETPALPAEDMQEWALAWLAEIEKALGVRPVFYSYPAFIVGKMGGAPRLREYQLWLADYGRNDGKRHDWGRTSLKFLGGFDPVAHQFTSNGRIAGERRIDLNHAESLETLRVRRTPVKPATARILPGPARKPKWFWPAVREFLRRRQKA